MIFDIDGDTQVKDFIDNMIVQFGELKSVKQKKLNQNLVKKY